MKLSEKSLPGYISLTRDDTSPVSNISSSISVKSPSSLMLSRVSAKISLSWGRIEPMIRIFSDLMFLAR